MEITAKLQTWGLILFSVVTSFLLVFYTVTVYFSEETAPGLRWFAYVTGGYGLMHIYVLSWAWHSRSNWAAKFDTLIAGCFLGVIAINILRSPAFDLLTGSATIVVAATVLYLNILAVKRTCTRPIK